ncbi:MAG: hypothetical protein ACJ8OJ_12390 [Povalibacter sp.]
MDENKALAIVSALANGVNPLTGEVFPPESPYQTADVVRALFLVSSLLESRAKPKSRTTGLPGNAGKPWTTEEDHQLLQEFDRGSPLATLAQAHGRTTAGIQARLEKHGRLQASAGPEGQTRRWRSATNGPSPSAPAR